MRYYYVELDDNNVIVAILDLKGLIYRDNAFRISESLYSIELLGKVYDVEKKEVIENE